MKHQLLASITYASLLSAKFVYGTPAAACNALQSALPGRVFFPGSEEYVVDNEHYTQASSQNSTCSVEPETPDDIALILKTVASGDTRSPFAVKGAGHTGNAGFSSTPGVQIAMLRFNDLEYNESQSTVKIGAGLAWDEVYARLQPYGVKVLGGRAPGVGVAGFLLGGGYTYFTDQYGLAVDNIVSHELVLPNGTFVEASEQVNPDLFFALKGGFNNFGIVTSFTLKAYPQTDVWAANIAYPMNVSDAVQQATVNFSFNNTDLKAVDLTLYVSSGFNDTSMLVLLFYDAPTPPEGFFDDFLNIPGAIVNQAGTMTLGEAAQALGGGLSSLNPPHTLRHVTPIQRYTIGILEEIRTQFEKIVSDAAADNRPYVFIDLAAQPFIQPFAHSTDSAYPHPASRNLCPTGLEAHWINSADDEFFVNAIDEVQRAIQARAIAEGQSRLDDILYPNYAPADTPLELLYGDNLERLQAIRKQVDPDDVMGLTGGFRITEC
ncbi:hypothetical protein VNI00_016733 [Paramarasmius palmivorus]|uniref:FAD-binding PCMH-type domain-containing protein n=1 Tax=Paramarasmius palmivorus TaxID=297713 RepID=A0AAW0BBV5_9AGAR